MLTDSSPLLLLQEELHGSLAATLGGSFQGCARVNHAGQTAMVSRCSGQFESIYTSFDPKLPFPRCNAAFPAPVRQSGRVQNQELIN